MKENIILDKSYKFAIRIIKLYKYLCEQKHEYVLSKQVLRCGTSIGANVEEAVGGQSKNDFISKLSVAYKEARETRYWINLLRDMEYVDQKGAGSLITDCDEILRILGKIQITTKQQIRNS